jgi:Txe/YoeB family toxin of Txe-Axe toxin-antitoxin module
MVPYELLYLFTQRLRAQRVHRCCLYWQMTDKAMLKRINQLIRDIQREPLPVSASQNRSSIN